MNLKIKKYKKIKNNLYKITFDNNEIISLYDDVILYYNLLLKKEISDKELKDIVLYNNKYEAYDNALKFISKKLRVEDEVKKHLKNYDSNTIKYVINKLKEDGYLNNDIYIKAYVNDEINLKFTGPNKILFDLKKLKLNEEDILLYLESIDNEVWINKIDKYVLKKINSNHNLSGSFLKRKLYEELYNKGFYKEDINIILDKYEFIDNEDIYNKEYNKIYNKYKNKYSEEELNYYVKNYMIKKGFNFKD